jgi:hypothetical protein
VAALEAAGLSIWWDPEISPGQEQLQWTKSDPDLDALRDDPRFQAMIKDAEQRLAATSA